MPDDPSPADDTQQTLTALRMMVGELKAQIVAHTSPCQERAAALRTLDETMGWVRAAMHRDAQRP